MASLMLATFMSGTGTGFASPPARFQPWHGCHKRYTVQMAERAALRIYAGTRDVPRSALRHLGWYERCQRIPRLRATVRDFDHRQAQHWAERRAPAAALTDYGTWAIPPAIVKCESGYRNLPPNSAGASGYYQIIPSTWAHFDGYRAAYLAPKSVQDQKAAYIWRYEGGAEQWVCKA